MDLRIVKTRHRIRQAFLKLRYNLMPENIKVKDICEMAMINKTTFYKHYTDSTELSNEIEENAVDKVLSFFIEKSSILKSPKEYLSSLFSALETEADNLKVVFRGRPERFSAKLTDKLIALCTDAISCLEDEVRISFAIGGFARVVNDFIFTKRKVDLDVLTNYTVSILHAIQPQQSEQQ